MKKLLLLLLTALCAAPLFASAAPPRHEPRMSDREFAVLYRRVQEKMFKADRLELIEIGSLDSRFGCEQCERLLRLFDFDDDRLAALAFLAPHIVDRRRAERLLDCFTFDSSKKRALQLLFDR